MNFLTISPQNLEDTNKCEHKSIYVRIYLACINSPFLSKCILRWFSTESMGKTHFSKTLLNVIGMLYFGKNPFLGSKTTSKNHLNNLQVKICTSLSRELVSGAFRWSAFEGFEWLLIAVSSTLVPPKSRPKSIEFVWRTLRSSSNFLADEISTDLF